MKQIIPCENCGEECIEIIETRSGYVIKKGFTGRSGPQYYKGTRRYITEKCPKCGAYHGKKAMTHEERINNIKRRGLPLRIKSGTSN